MFGETVFVFIHSYSTSILCLGFLDIDLVNGSKYLSPWQYCSNSVNIHQPKSDKRILGMGSTWQFINSANGAADLNQTNESALELTILFAYVTKKAPANTKSSVSCGC